MTKNQNTMKVENYKMVKRMENKVVKIQNNYKNKRKMNLKQIKPRLLRKLKKIEMMKIILTLMKK